jgi:hypothetical protein
MGAVVSPPDDLRVERVARIAAAAEVERRLCELAAHVHAATAELTRLAAEFHELEGWCGEGVRSFSHWLTINAGFSPHSGDELLGDRGGGS